MRNNSFARLVAIVIVPSTAVETMQLGGIAGLTALTMGIGQYQANKTNGNSAAVGQLPSDLLSGDAN